MSDKTVIYSMVGMSKIHGQKTVLKNIYLSYYYGAKIGVLGPTVPVNRPCFEYHGGRRSGFYR